MKTGFFSKSLLEKRGFSLVEVIVVMTIIIILAGIALPRYGFLKDSARIVEARSGLVNFYRNQQTFYIENGYYGLSDEIGFEFDSKYYKLGFYDSFKGANISANMGNQCAIGPDRNSFQAGSVNKNNKLINLTINEQNCLKKIIEGSSDCSQTSGDCISY